MKGSLGVEDARTLLLVVYSTVVDLSVFESAVPVDSVKPCVVEAVSGSSALAVV